VVLTGGGARSDVVRQLLADVLGRPVLPLSLRSASAVGAARLAAEAVGLDVAPRRDADAPVEPRPGAPMAAAAERWHRAGPAVWNRAVRGTVDGSRGTGPGPHG
jgi:xylulokinase